MSQSTLSDYFRASVGEKRPRTTNQEDQELEESDIEEPEEYTSESEAVSKSKHKQGKYDAEWENEFSWVHLEEGGMYCKLCKYFNTRNERNVAAVFNTTPCV